MQYKSITPFKKNNFGVEAQNSRVKKATEIKKKHGNDTLNF